jgi:hypothetical protein
MKKELSMPDPTSPKDAVKAVAETIGAYLIGLRVEKLNGDVLRCEVLSFDDKEPPLIENYHSQEITHIHPLHYAEALSQVRKQALLEAAQLADDMILYAGQDIANAIRKLAEE